MQRTCKIKICWNGTDSRGEERKKGKKVAKSKVGSWIGKFYTQPEVPVHQNIFLNGQQKKTLPLFSICIPGPSIGQSKHSVLQIIFV